MKLNHLNLSVTNVAEAINFFESYFNFTCVAIKGENIIAVLKGADNFELVLMAATMNLNGNINYPDAFHIGFILDNTEKVYEIFEHLQNGNIIIEHAPRKIRDSFGFYFHFDNIMIEIGTAVAA